MIKINEVEIKVYPLILESNQAASLWHLIRALDIKGSGKLSFTFKELTSITGYTKSTIYRYMKSPLFNKVCKTKNKGGDLVYSFYYKSLKEVTKELSISNLITSSFCMWKDIKHFYTKRVTSTEIIAESVQQRSRYLARNFKNKNQVLVNIDEVFPEDLSSLSDNTQGNKEINTNRLLLSSKHYAVYGASQTTIANILTRNVKTVNKRLKNTVKVQQFIKRDSSHQAMNKFFDKEEGTNIAGSKYITINNCLYERYTNLYSPQYCLKIKKLSYGSSVEAAL